MAISSFSFQVSISAVNSWMWIYLPLFLLLWTSCYNTSVTGQHQVMGSSQPVLAKVGDDVILPCHIEPSVSAAKWTVEWTRHGLKPEYVHMLQHGEVISDVLNLLYKKRTSLFHEELPHGNISLKLSRVQLSDEGKFKCFVTNLRSSREIQLLVGAVSQPVISVIGSIDEGLSLTCDSGCWYPQPEVSWLDSEGNNFTAESSVTDRPSQHCYAVQSNVTVRGAGHVTCRVHLPRFNHTVETRYDIPGKESRLNAGWIAGIVITVILLASILGGYFYWKKKEKTDKDITDEQKKLLKKVHKEQYQLNSKPRGLCLIIVNEKFKDSEKKRAGAIKDADQVGRLFDMLGFRVLMCKDQTKRQMKMTLECISSLKNISELQKLNAKEWSVKDTDFTALRVEEPLQHTDAFVCYISSHGYEGGVLGTDEEILFIKDITTPFNVENCPVLENKPKLFLFDAGLEGQSEEHSMEDHFLVAIANKEGHCSYHDKVYGSDFTHAVCKQLHEGHESGGEIQAILKKAIKEVIKKKPPAGWDKPQIPLVRNNLKKNLVF